MQDFPIIVINLFKGTSFLSFYLFLLLLFLR